MSYRCIIASVVTAGTLLTSAFPALACNPEHTEPGASAPWVGTTLDGGSCRGDRQGFGPYDYVMRNRYSCAISLVETAHFPPQVENLVAGAHSGTAHGDIDYTLRAWPNHHRALSSRVRLGLRDVRTNYRSKKYPPAECYLQRAINFSPEDALPHLLFGIYLHSLGRDEMALQHYQLSEEMAPYNLQVKYNLGLYYTDKGQYEEALKYAHEVYSRDYPLPGLKRKLTEAGQWREPAVSALELETGATSVE